MRVPKGKSHNLDDIPNPKIDQKNITGFRTEISEVRLGSNEQNDRSQYINRMKETRVIKTKWNKKCPK